MFKRRKRRGDTSNGSLQQSSPSVAASQDTPSCHESINADHGILAPPLMTDAFKVAFERATDSAKNELAFSGKLGPEVFFVYTDNTMKVVSLSFKDELHKELLKTRIREKALAEEAFAVIILTEMDNEGHKLVLSGVSPGMKASVCVNYRFDNESKTVTLWKINWLNQPFQNVLIDGIFDTAP